MGKGKRYCEWCGGETKNPPSMHSPITIIEELEDKIDELGRDNILNKYYTNQHINIDVIDRSKLYAYLDLLSDIKERIICTPCENNFWELDDKYYGYINNELFPIYDENGGEL